MIKAYVGLPGMGKTLNMVKDMMSALVEGRRVITNTPIAFKHGGKEYRAEYIGNPHRFERAILEETNCLIAIDEASIFFSSQFWQKLSGEFIMKFAQTRKYQCDIYYTSQGYTHTVKRLRDLTNLVGKCNAIRLPLTPWVIYKLTWLDPEYYSRNISSEKIQQYIVGSPRNMFPAEFKRVIQAYNTFQTIEGSALFHSEGLTRKPESEEAGFLEND